MSRRSWQHDDINISLYGSDDLLADAQVHDELADPVHDPYEDLLDDTVTTTYSAES